MGLALEIIFLFFAINYLAIEFIKGKATSSECKRERAAIDDDFARAKEMREYAMNIEGVVCSYITTEENTFKIDRDMERECVEVFRTLPLWKNVKSWDIVRDSEHKYLKGKEREKAESRERRYMRKVSDIIYFANRGKIPSDMLCVRRDDFYLCGFDEEQELMLWWRNKIRDMGVKHELWFCYEEPIELKNGERTVYSETRQYKCPVEFASPSLRNGRYCWDVNFYAINSQPVNRPSDLAQPYEISGCPAHWFTTAAISTDYVMRLPTSIEWTRLCNSYDLLNESKFDVRFSSLLQGKMCGELVVRSVGSNYVLPSWWSWEKCFDREKYSSVSEDCFWHSAFGHFRPAFELTTDDIYERMSYEVGKAYVIGTLYMEGKPVRITTGDPPIEITRNKRGDKDRYEPRIEHYEVASILELGEPREDPQYQIMGIYIGDGVFISRDILLDKMSYSDVIWSINKAKELRAIAENNG